MWAGRAEAGPRAGLGRGRWSLQVPSKCFEWTERRPFELSGSGFGTWAAHSFPSGASFDNCSFVGAKLLRRDRETFF